MKSVSGTVFSIKSSYNFFIGAFFVLSGGEVPARGYYLILKTVLLFIILVLFQAEPRKGIIRVILKKKLNTGEKFKMKYLLKM